MTDNPAHDPLADEQAMVVITDMPCLACGYNLRGLDPHGFCPECGHSNLRTVESRRSMTKRELAALAFRVTAVWMALGWIEDFISTWGTFFYGDNLFQAVTTAAWTGLYVLLTVMLWLKAEYLAKHAIIHDGPLSLSGRLVHEQCMSIALSVIGVIYIVFAISSASWSVAALFRESQQNYAILSLVSSAVNLLIGCVLLIGAGRIASFVMWLRTAGTNREI